MSTLNPPKSISKRHELRQDRVVTVYARAWDFIDKNRSVVYGILGVITVILLAIVGYYYWNSQQEVKAQAELGAIVPVYEEGNYRAALDGTETARGLLDIAENFGSTEAGNLARFYAADALFRLGSYDEALRWFEAYDKSENLIGSSALAGEASVYESKGDFQRAGDLYREAALYFDNELTSPQYLLNAGRAYEKAEAFGRAHDAYQLVKDQYPESQAATSIDVYLARVNAEMN